VLPPLIMGMIVYPMVGLVPGWAEFGCFLLVLVLFNLTAAALCLFIGIIFEESGVANLIGSLVMLFSLLFAGLLLNHGTQTPLDLGADEVRFHSAGFWLDSGSVGFPLCV
jgi:drug/metabolite transporter (DMT)-like permease